MVTWMAGERGAKKPRDSRATLTSSTDVPRRPVRATIRNSMFLQTHGSQVVIEAGNDA